MRVWGSAGLNVVVCVSGNGSGLWVTDSNATARVEAALLISVGAVAAAWATSAAPATATKIRSLTKLAKGSLNQDGRLLFIRNTAPIKGLTLTACLRMDVGQGTAGPSIPKLTNYSMFGRVAPNNLFGPACHDLNSGSELNGFQF